MPEKASKPGQFRDREKPLHVREDNFNAAKGVADAVRTSLGPKGMDKMIQSGSGDVMITNDGATILKQISAKHPAARMFVDLSQSQDIEAGDGTTTVVIIAGSLLAAAQKLLKKSLHPTAISESFGRAAVKAVEILTSIAQPIDLNDRGALIRSASTALNSKVVSQHADILAPIAVDAVMKIVSADSDNCVDLRNVRVVKKLGGTVEDTEMVDGLVLNQRLSVPATDAGRSRVEKAKIGLIQFCISAPKTDMENNVVISDYAQMDRVLREERQYTINIVKQIKKSGCNVLLVQKSILRDALSDLAMHFLGKAKIAVIREIEREEVPFICNSLGLKPIASLDHFSAECLASADVVEETSTGAAKVVRIRGIQPAPIALIGVQPTVSLLVRGSNKLVLDEAERSLHDALCVVRCLVKNRALVAGGGAPEMELALRLAEYSHTLTGVDAYCFRAYAEALDVIPYTLAENAGLSSIATVTELRNRHAEKQVNAGINVRKGAITDMLEENVVQPVLVTISAIQLATDSVRSLLKIDDIVYGR